MIHTLIRTLARLPLLLVATIIAIGAGGAQDAAAQTTITLNLSVRVNAPDAKVTLAEIARLEGPESGRFGEVVMLERADAKASVALADVRAKLQAAGANLGKLTLRGSSCRIELPSAAPAAAKARPEKARTGPDYKVIDASGPPTLRTAIARRLASMHNVGFESLQIAFDEKDVATLDTPYTERQVVQVQPAAASTSSRIPLRISVYVGDKVVADYRLTADVLLLREAVVATRDIDRRETITAADVRLEPRWIAPGDTMPSREAIVGSLARTRIKDGETISGADLDSPVAIKRGDVVYVQCLSGSIVVQARARALGPGREGETIAFQMEGASESFTARVAGPGRAVMLAGPESDATGKEPAEVPSSKSDRSQSRR